VLTGLSLPPALGHELAEDRLTIVQRDARHLSLQLLVDMPALLHRVNAPKQPGGQFILTLSTQPASQLEAAMRKVQQRVQTELQLRQAGRVLKPSNWRWPDTAKVQEALRQRAMQMVVAPHEHGHESTLKIEADVLAPQDIAGLSLALPAELKPLMVVSYRPQQRWVAPGDGLVAIPLADKAPP
jgi:hypothetical protein